MATSSLTELVSSDSYDNLFIVLRKYDSLDMLCSRATNGLCVLVLRYFPLSILWTNHEVLLMGTI